MNEVVVSPTGRSARSLGARVMPVCVSEDMATSLLSSTDDWVVCV